MMYVEVFGGGGSILLNKERSVREKPWPRRMV